MRAQVFRLLMRLSALGLPMGVVLASYLWLDPFCVVRRDLRPADYAEAARFGVAPNRDHALTEWLHRHHREQGYDAFILGNSRSMAFATGDWLPWIAPATPYHWDAPGESLFGVRGKLRLIEREGIALRHALLVLDRDLLQKTAETESVLYIKHPLVSGGSWARFHGVFVRAYLSRLFFVRYVDFRLFGVWRDSMAGFLDRQLIHGEPQVANAVTGDFRFTGLEARIDADPASYFRPGNGSWPSERPAPSEGPEVVGAAHAQLLLEIQDLLKKQGADYEIAIVPSYDRVRLHPSDVRRLSEIFAPDRVHDFSGDPTIAPRMEDWLEPYHFRRPAALAMLRRIYTAR